MNYIVKKRRYTFLIFLIDLIGSIVFFPFKIFRRKHPGNISNILVIRLDHIGDVIFSTPIPESLKAHYKGAKITFLMSASARNVIINNPYVDEIMCYDAPWFDRRGKKIFELTRFLKLAGEIRKHNYDLGIDLRGDIRHILLMAMAGVRFKVGYGISGGGFLLSRKVNYRQGVHAIEHNFDLLRDLGIAIVSTKPKIYTSSADEETASDIMQKDGLDKGSVFMVLIHTTAGYKSKNWLDSRFIELIRILAEKYNAVSVLVGSEDDGDKNDRILKASGVRGVNISGKTSLSVLSALIKRASLFIGVDSGPAHIAALEGIPCVILYSGTNNSDEWAGIGSKVCKIQKDISCKGCEKLDCEQNICMDLISVEDVVDAVEEVLGKAENQV